MLKRISMAFALIAAASLALETSANFTATGTLGVVPAAHARVGRPLTPVSVAGVTRRTVRRCAVDVVVC